VKGVAGHLEKTYRQRELHGRPPHQPGARYRQGRTSVANGDLKRKLTMYAKGEIAELSTPSRP